MEFFKFILWYLGVPSLYTKYFYYCKGLETWEAAGLSPLASVWRTVKFWHQKLNELKNSPGPRIHFLAPHPC